MTPNTTTAAVTSVADALGTLTAGRDSDAPNTAAKAGKLTGGLRPGLEKLREHHADLISAIEEAEALADQLDDADTTDERHDLHGELVDALTQVTDSYAELGVQLPAS